MPNLTHEQCAEQIAAIIRTDPFLRPLHAFLLNVCVISLPRRDGRHGLMVNLFLRRDSLTLDLIWHATTRLLRHLHRSGLLAGYESAAIRVYEAANGTEPDRILLFNTDIAALPLPRLRKPGDLLSATPDVVYWYKHPDHVLRP